MEEETAGGLLQDEQHEQNKLHATNHHLFCAPLTVDGAVVGPKALCFAQFSVAPCKDVNRLA
jgi:hypothetical protein